VDARSRRRIAWPLAALAAAAAVAWLAPEEKSPAPRRLEPPPRVPLHDVPMSMSRPSEASPAAPDAGQRPPRERDDATNRR
jgi:hypothetical protein